MHAERFYSHDPEVQARQERIHRLLDELKESTARKRALFDRWRAEGRLPPKEPRGRC
jgi:hypothetical protein